MDRIKPGLFYDLDLSMEERADGDSYCPKCRRPLRGTSCPSCSRKRNRIKGNAKELEAQRYLERQGYLVHRAVTSGMKRGGLWISRSNDVFNDFDLVAKRIGEKTLYAQITYAGNASPHRKKILEHAAWYDTERDDHELWLWHAGRPTAGSKKRQQWTAERLNALGGFTRLGYLHIGDDDAKNLQQETRDQKARKEAREGPAEAATTR